MIKIGRDKRGLADAGLCWLAFFLYHKGISYQKLCARVNSRFDICRGKNTEFIFSLFTIWWYIQ